MLRRIARILFCDASISIIGKAQASCSTIQCWRLKTFAGLSLLLMKCSAGWTHSGLLS